MLNFTLEDRGGPVSSDIIRKLDSIETSQTVGFNFLALLHFYSLQQSEAHACSLEEKL